MIVVAPPVEEHRLEMMGWTEESVNLASNEVDLLKAG